MGVVDLYDMCGRCLLGWDRLRASRENVFYDVHIHGRLQRNERGTRQERVSCNYAGATSGADQHIRVTSVTPTPQTETQKEADRPIASADTKE